MYLLMLLPPYPSLHLVTMLSQIGECQVEITNKVKLKFMLRHPEHLEKNHSLGFSNYLQHYQKVRVAKKLSVSTEFWLHEDQDSVNLLSDAVPKQSEDTY